jgi:hypothetical protein
LGEFDLGSENLRGKACLAQIHLVDVDRQHMGSTTSLHLDRIETAVAPDIEHRLPRKSAGSACAKRRHFTAG